MSQNLRGLQRLSSTVVVPTHLTLEIGITYRQRLSPVRVPTFSVEDHFIAASKEFGRSVGLSAVPRFAFGTINYVVI